jgi:7,8-dihydro-6-hydroxymethylpterin dimethyltransferase
VHHAKQTDLDVLGIAKTAREEKKRARDSKMAHSEDEKMARLYREVVLKEKRVEGFVPIGDLTAGPLGGIAPAPAPAKKQEEVGSFGD